VSALETKAAADVYVGVDVGTSQVKTVAVDSQGRVLALARSPTPQASDGYGSVHDPQALWALVQAQVAQVWREAGEGWIRGVAFASIGEEGVFVDGAGRPLYPSLVWYEARETSRSRAFAQAHPDEEVYARTGMAHSPIRTLHKWLWLGEHQPQVVASARWWLSISEYFAFVLGGEPLMSRSQASRTLAWSLVDEAWILPWVEEVGVSPQVLPPVVPSGTVAGTVRAHLLPGVRVAEGARVVVAGHDHPVGASAAGVRETGDVLDSLGTAESLLTPMERARPDREDLEEGLEYGATADGEPHYIMTASQSGRFLKGWAELVGGDARLPALEEQASLVAPGAEGTVFYPPVEAGGGALTGVGPQVRPEVWYRAVLEGWAYRLRWSVEHLARRTGTLPRRIYVIGGGARSTLSLRIRASVLGVPLWALDAPEAVALGAARLAARADGADLDPRLPAHRIEPQDDWREAYQGCTLAGGRRWKAAGKRPCRGGWTLPRASLGQLAEQARRQGRAVGAFNVENWEMAVAVVDEAARVGVPVALQVSEKTLDLYGGARLVGALAALACPWPCTWTTPTRWLAFGKGAAGGSPASCWTDPTFPGTKTWPKPGRRWLWPTRWAWPRKGRLVTWAGKASPTPGAALPSPKRPHALPKKRAWTCWRLPLAPATARCAPATS
jgi:xylulokinase